MTNQCAVRPSEVETIYANMPLFGLAAATTHLRAEGGLGLASGSGVKSGGGLRF